VRGNTAMMRASRGGFTSGRLDELFRCANPRPRSEQSVVRAFRNINEGYACAQPNHRAARWRAARLRGAAYIRLS
jgi:hypothetical protein